MSKWVVAAAWPYINSVPHLGTVLHLLTADVYARYLRQLGEDVISVSGSDEHGTPIEVEARRRSIDPRALTDEAHEYVVGLLKKWGIELSNYSRTESEVHKEFVRDFMRRLEERGYIQPREQTLPYCEKDKIFLPDRFIIGTCPRCGYPEARGDQCDNCGALLDPTDLINPRCVFCGSKPVYATTVHWFFDLSKVENEIRRWLEEHPRLDDRVKKYSLSWVREGLRPRAVTRDVRWGIRAPFKGAEEKTIYVWFDALLGYLSASKEYLEKNGRRFEDFWKDPNTKTVYFIGKDNIPFHAVILPAMLIASGENYPLPYHISSTEYILYEGEKFSKSRRIGLWIDEALEIIPEADYWRYALMRMRPEERDSNFSWREFHRIVNSELNDDIGNFVHRVLIFIRRFFNSTVPEPGEFDDIDRETWSEIDANYREYIDLMDRFKIKQALERILNLSRIGNQYLNRRAPWDELKKDPSRAATTIYISVNIVGLIALLLYPFTPSSSEKLWKMLGMMHPIRDIVISRRAFYPIEPGTRLSDNIEPLFKKLPENFLEEVERVLLPKVREKIQKIRPESLRF
ncbi:MAG: methionine--tRNA ligase [Sulfolobales archaeon]|jgi:methionyl-tRNA synthetase